MLHRGFITVRWGWDKCAGAVCSMVYAAMRPWLDDARNGTLLDRLAWWLLMMGFRAEIAGSLGGTLKRMERVRA